jgi:hypothetical protein
VEAGWLACDKESSSGRASARPLPFGVLGFFGGIGVGVVDGGKKDDQSF